MVNGAISGSATTSDIFVSNPSSSGALLDVVWVVASCDVGAALEFAPVTDGYHLALQRVHEGVCAGGTGLAAVELELSQSIPPATVSTEMVGFPASTNEPSATLDLGAIADCPGATGDADIRNTYLVGNTEPSWITTPPDPGQTRLAGKLAVVASSLPTAIALLDPESGVACRLAGLNPSARIDKVAWSPAGDALAVSLQRSDAQRLYEVVVWSAAGITLPWRGSGQVSLDWSSDGSKLALGGFYGGAILSVDGTPNIVVDGTSDSPLFSPNGDHVAFWRSPGPSGPDPQGSVEIVDSTSGISVVTIQIGGRSPLEWLDQDHIAMLDGTVNSVVSVAMDGTTGTPGSQFKSWARVEPGELGSVLAVYGADGSVVRSDLADVIPPNAGIGAITWSPTSLELAVSAVDRGTGLPLGIWTINADGTGQHGVPHEPGLNFRLVSDLSSDDLIGDEAWQPIWR
jgi:hypothetical protein